MTNFHLALSILCLPVFCFGFVIGHIWIVFYNGFQSGKWWVLLNAYSKISKENQ